MKLALYPAICSVSESARPVNALEKWVGPGPTQETEDSWLFLSKKGNLSFTGSPGSCPVLVGWGEGEHGGYCVGQGASHHFPHLGLSSSG